MNSCSLSKIKPNLLKSRGGKPRGLQVSRATLNKKVARLFYGTVDFELGPETFNLMSTANIFIRKLENNGNFA